MNTDWKLQQKINDARRSYERACEANDRTWKLHGCNSRAWWQASERCSMWEGRLAALGWRKSDFDQFAKEYADKKARREAAKVLKLGTEMRDCSPPSTSPLMFNPRS